MHSNEKNVEVEMRGSLTAEQYARLKSFLDKNAKKTSTKNRVLIDYSSFLPGEMKDRKEDIRLRITNGVPEMIIKLGGWGAVDQRKELSVTTGPGTFDTLVEIFSVLGYTKGMLCQRKIEVYEYKEVEFALVEIPGHSFFYEAEKMISENQDMETTAQEIRSVCSELELPIFTGDEFFAYVETLNREANEVFDFSKEGSGYFKKRFGF
jgi:adenylate cyclase class IV